MGMRCNCRDWVEWVKALLVDERYEWAKGTLAGILEIVKREGHMTQGQKDSLLRIVVVGMVGEEPSCD